jgi:hypothetical protein
MDDMELLLARQSILIKCSLNASILMGNYEFYYAGGLLCRLAKTQPQPGMQPEQLYAFLQPLLDTYQPKNEQESYLVKLLREYKVSGEYDAQMEQLFEMGLKEKYLWMVQPPQE